MLRSCDYYASFDQAKILYQEIQFHPSYAFSGGPLHGNNKVFLLPTSDRYLLAVLNSPLMWWYNWRHLHHMKDDALTPTAVCMETLPIAEPTPEIRTEAKDGVAALLVLAQESQDQTRELLNWLRHELGVDQPGQRLEAFADLTGDEFVAEVRKRRPKGVPRLNPRTLTELTATHRHYAEPERARAAQVRALERRLSDLVIQAYRLTDEYIDLLWRTAPPWMPTV